VILGFFTPETLREAMMQGIKEAVELLIRFAKGEADKAVIIP
jgi:hypothetical protein